MAKKNKKQLEDELNRYGREYEIAKARGDKKGMDVAHAKANQTRKEGGWSYDSKRGYTVDGARIVNSKENLALAKSGGNTVKAAKKVAQDTPITKRYTPTKSNPKPKFSQPSGSAGQPRTQIQTSNAFTSPPPISVTSRVSAPKQSLTSNAFTPPPAATPARAIVANKPHASPSAVWQDAEREKKRTRDAEQRARERALEKLKWKYERNGEFKPFGTVPQAAAYGFERGADGIAGGIENIIHGAAGLVNKGMKFTASLGGLAPNPVSEWFGENEQFNHDFRLTDAWRQSIEERYQPTDGMRKAGDLGETIGNMTPSILADLALNMQTGFAPAVGKGVAATMQAMEHAPRVGMALMGLNSYGAGTHRAAMEGADSDSASLYGALSAAGETLSENMFSAIPGLDRTGIVSKSINKFVKNPMLAKGVDIAGEGAEEAVMAIADPYLQRMTYNPNAKNAMLDEIKEQAVMGMLAAGVMQGGAAVGNKIIQGRHSERNYQHSAPKNQYIPDFEAQWNRYNQLGQAGLPFEQVIPYETNTPVDYETAYSAHASGYNDFIERTKQTAERILAGNGTDANNIAEVLSSPPARQMLEEEFGFTFSEHYPEAVKQVQTVANALHEKTQMQERELPARATDPTPAQGLPLSPEVTSDFERRNMSAEVQAEQNAERQQLADLPQQINAPVSQQQSQTVGVIQNEATQTVDKGTVDSIDRIAKRTGFSVEFVQGVQEAGSYQDGKIRINTESGDPVRQVFVHELTHHLEQSGEYNALAQTILDEINKDGALADVQQYIQEKYKANGIELDEDGIRREIVAEFAEENLFTDERAIGQLARKNRSLFQKIRDWLHGLRVKLRGTAEEKFIWKTEQMYQKVLDSLDPAKSQTLGVSENGQKNNASSEIQYKVKQTVNEKTDTSKPIDNEPEKSLSQKEAKPVFAGLAMNREYRDAVERGDTGLAKEMLEKRAQQKGYLQYNSKAEKQNHIVQKNNAVEDEYHTWIRSEHDVKTFEETLRDPEFKGEDFTPDYTWQMAQDALQSGEIRVYSSYPIGTIGGFVTPSYMEAESYAGGGEVYSKVVDIDEIAWIDPTQGQYAPVSSKPNAVYGNGPGYEKLLEITYDNNGKLIPLTRRFDYTKEDPKYKVTGASSINEIIKQNREQAKTINALRAQLRQQSDGVVTDPTSVKRLVRELLNDYSSTYDKVELTGQIQEIYDDIANNTAGNGDIQTRIRQAAQDILEHAAVLNTETEADYKGVRKYLKDNKLTLSEQDQADIPDYNSFRKSLFGTIKVGNDGIPVDVAYAEMTEMFGEGLFPSDITHPAEQLTHIADTVRALKPVLENPHTKEMQAATRMLSDEIYERFFDLSQHPTRGRRQQRELEAVRAQANERLVRALEQERQKRDKAIEKIKARQRTTQNELRRRITQHASKLSSLLLKPSDTRHIVENERQTKDGQTVSMRKTVAALLETINLESQYSIDPETGKRIYTGETEGQLTKRTEQFRELRKMYQAISADDRNTMVVDPDLLYNLDTLSELSDTKLTDYTTEQLYTLWNTIHAVESSITNENKLFSQMRYSSIKALADQITNDNRRDVQKSEGGKFQTMLSVGMKTPYHFFRSLGKGGEAVFKELERARGQYILDTDWSIRYLKQLKGDIDTSNWSGEKAEKITFQTESGQQGRMTRAQRISLYLLSKRKQGMQHLTAENGGIVMKEKGTETHEAIHLTKADIQRITAEMTAEERHVADGISQAMQHFAAWGNEASMKLYGYEKFGEKNYYPIQTDSNSRKDENPQRTPGEAGYRVKNAGMTKSTDSGARNPVILRDAFEVFGRHASEMANYHALAPVLTDIDRIFGYQQWTNGKRTGSVKESIENSMGQAGQRYWKNLIDQLNIGLQRESTPFSKLFSNFKAAKVGANLRVVVQQPLSYFRAGHAIDGKYLIAGLKGHTDTEIMEKYAPIAKWKSWGYSELDTGRQLSDILSGKKETAIERIKEVSMWLPGKADEMTWKALWRAVEAEIRHETNLKQGTDAFYTAVGERFTEIVDRTQVVDTVLNRSAVMRDGGMGHQIGTMFLAEPTLDYNEVLASYETVKAGKKGAGKQMLRGAFWLALSGLAKAVVTSIVDAGRDKDEDEAWTQKFRQAFIGIEGDEQDWKDYTKNLVSGNLIESVNPVGWIPFLKDIYSLMQGFDRKSPDTALAADLMKTCSRFYGAVTGQNNVALPAASVELLAKIADVSGVPLSSLKREIESFINTILLVPSVRDSRVGQELKFSFRQFHTKMTADNVREWVKYGQKNFTDTGMMEKFKRIMLEEQLATEQDFRDVQAGGRSKELSDLVSQWKKEVQNGNTQAADEIVQAMDKLGYSDKKVQGRLSAAEQALVRETWAFRQRASDHNVRITDKATATKQYQQMDVEQREDFASFTRQYVGALALSETDKSKKLEDFTTKWYAKARDAKTVGLSEERFLMAWTVTKNIKSLKDREGKTIPNSSSLLMMEAIYAIPGLSDKQREYLFEARGVGDKAMRTRNGKGKIKNPAKVKEELEKMRKEAGGK